MTEDDLKKLSELIESRNILKGSLKKKHIKDLHTNTDWHFGSAVDPHKRIMREAVKECREVCELILDQRVQMLLREIDRKLKELGMESDNDPT